MTITWYCLPEAPSADEVSERAKHYNPSTSHWPLNPFADADTTGFLTYCVPPTMQTQPSALKLQLTKHGITMTLRTARRIDSAIVANARVQLTRLGITRLGTTRRIHSAIVASTSIEHG